jgi:hypothetical protein
LHQTIAIARGRLLAARHLQDDRVTLGHQERQGLEEILVTLDRVQATAGVNPAGLALPPWLVGHRPPRLVDVDPHRCDLDPLGRRVAEVLVDLGEQLLAHHQRERSVLPLLLLVCPITFERRQQRQTVIDACQVGRERRHVCGVTSG